MRRVRWVLVRLYVVIMAVTLALVIEAVPASANYSQRIDAIFYGFPEHTYVTVDLVGIASFRPGVGPNEESGKCARFHSAGPKVIQKGTMVNKNDNNAFGVDPKLQGYSVTLGTLEIENDSPSCFVTPSRAFMQLTKEGGEKLVVFDVQQAIGIREFFVNCHNQAIRCKLQLTQQGTRQVADNGSWTYIVIDHR